MIKEAMEWVVGHAEAKQHQVEGRVYYDKELIAVKPPSVSPVKLCSLESLIDYIKWGKENLLTPENYLIHVKTPTYVQLVSAAETQWKQRDIIAVANVSDHLNEFSFGDWVSQDRFIVDLQTCFVRDDNLEKVLKFAGRVTDEQVRTSADDGTTQEVQVKAGVALQEEAKVPNPVELSPFRSFFEVEQVESKFIFRVRRTGSAPQFALFEAEGGAWQMAAKQKVKEYLKGKLENYTVIA